MQLAVSSRLVGFRDDNEALRQRVQALEGEVETLTEELEDAKTPKVRVEPELEQPKPAPPSADLAERIAAQEAQRAHAAAVEKQRELEAKQRRARGTRESKIVAGDGQTHLTLKRSVFGQIRKTLSTTLLMLPACAGAALPLAVLLQNLMPQVNPFFAAS